MKEKISRRNFIAGSIAGVGTASAVLNCSPKTEMKDVLATELPKRRLGRTGAMVSCIGFGGGSRYAMANERISEQLIDYAIQLGITYFDAARAYGGGKTETRYGRYLTPKYRKQIFLNSKSQMRDYDGVMRDIETSLKTMKTDYLDLYCMHGIDRMSDIDELLSPNGGYKAFRQLKDEGVVKNIGFSMHDWSDATEKAFENLDVDAILPAMNAARENGVEEHLLPRAKERDIAIIVIKATAQNALIGNVTGSDLVRYVLSRPIAVANVGMDSLGTLESCAAIGRERVLTDEEAEMIVAKLDYDPRKTRLPYFHARRA